MRKLLNFLQSHWLVISGALVALILLSSLLLFRLGSLTGDNVTIRENIIVNQIYGWHGLYNNPLYLPINIVRSAFFWTFPHHTAFLSRLPNVIFGVLATINLIIVIRFWHSTRTTILAGLLFATTSETLHVSRLATNDVIYLWAIPTLLLSYVLVQRFKTDKLIPLISLILWSGLIFIPGIIWFVALSIYWLRHDIATYIKLFSSRISLGLILLPGLLTALLLGRAFSTTPLIFVNWLGLPSAFAAPSIIAKQFLAIPVHLFIHGPNEPQLWLGRTPLLDIFSLAMAVVGIYFYIKHYRSSRSQRLFSFFILGSLLISTGGPLKLSLLVPIIYLAIAAGLALFLNYWLRVFPNNPFPRWFGISFVAVAVSVSCIYNLRAYFVAWPNDPSTVSSFVVRR